MKIYFSFFDFATTLMNMIQEHENFESVKNIFNGFVEELLALE